MKEGGGGGRCIRYCVCNIRLLSVDSAEKIGLYFLYCTVIVNVDMNIICIAQDQYRHRPSEHLCVNCKSVV